MKKKQQKYNCYFAIKNKCAKYKHNIKVILPIIRKMLLDLLIFWVIAMNILLIVTINNQKSQEPQLQVVELWRTNEVVGVYNVELGIITADGIKCNSYVKSWMSWRSITDTSSKQYKFIQNNMTIVKEGKYKGLLQDSEGYIGVALGSYFGEIGDKFIFELEDNKFLKVVKIDAKADKHTNSGIYQIIDGSVMEFVIDVGLCSQNDYLKQAMLNGSFNAVEDFQGNIINFWRIK